MLTTDEFDARPADDAPASADPANTLTTGLFTKALTTPPRVVGVMLPSVGVSVYVKRLPDDARKGLAATAAERAGPDAHRGRVLAAALCYADGSQGFDPAALEVIGKAAKQELDAAYQQACHLNGVSFLRDLPKGARPTPRPTG